VAVAVAAVTTAQRLGPLIGRLLSHPEPEQLLLRVRGTTLVVAALAELVGASAAVGAFLVGLPSPAHWPPGPAPS
jgi:CPA2 family monovalent cation:H+ antiporter-2